MAAICAIDAVEAVRELTGGNGADVVIEAVGCLETCRQAFYGRDLARTVVLVGVPTSEMALELPLLDVRPGRGAESPPGTAMAYPAGTFPC